MKKIPRSNLTVDFTVDAPEKKIKLDEFIGNGPEIETILCGRKLSYLHINYPNVNGLLPETVKDQLQVIHSPDDHWIVASMVGGKSDVVFVES
jgi:hypothetical protein